EPAPEQLRDHGRHVHAARPQPELQPHGLLMMAAWRRWRRSRPFWGGLLVILAGAEMLATERAPLRVVLHVGVQGLAGYLVPIIILLCGLLLWFNPAQSVFYSILAVLLSLVAWLTSNLGGFVIGLLLGVIGGSLSFGWAPGPRRSRQPRGGAAPER